MKVGQRKNRWDVQVVFPRFAAGIKSRSDVALTPADVASELEEFAARIRRVLAGENLPSGVLPADPRETRKEGV